MNGNSISALAKKEVKKVLTVQGVLENYSTNTREIYFYSQQS